MARAPRPRPVRGALRAGLRRPLDPFPRPRRFLLPRAIGPMCDRSGRPADPMHRGIHPGDFSAVRWVRRYIREYGPFDIIHGHSSKGGRWPGSRPAASDARVFYTPHAWFTHGPAPRLASNGCSTKRSNGPSARLTDRIIAVSPGGAAACDPDRPQPLPGDPDPQRDRAGRRFRRWVWSAARGSTSRRIAVVVGFVGRLVDQKAPDVLIEALAGTANMLPQCRLIVVGSGPLEGSLRTLADLLGVADRILWLGERDGKMPLARLRSPGPAQPQGGLTLRGAGGPVRRAAGPGNGLGRGRDSSCDMGTTG